MRKYRGMPRKAGDRPTKRKSFFLFSVTEKYEYKGGRRMMESSLSKG